MILITEGAPTILFAVVVFFFLPDSPGTAKFLTSEDQTYAVERNQFRDKTQKSKLSLRQIVAGLGDYQNYVHTLIHFSCRIGHVGMSTKVHLHL